ncbi:MAG: MMPL family transporter [Candidatus Riflebacteria bacterium]|nr:MMPL family transporter [Candidatus Riflebacteria bacterium]
MSLIECPECKKSISDQEINCPLCGKKVWKDGLSAASKSQGGPIPRLLATYLVKWRNPLFVVMTLLMLFLGCFMGGIKIDNSLELWFLEDDPTLAAYREFKKIYGNDEIIVAVVDCKKEGVFTPETLDKLWKVSKALKEDKKNFRRVVSLGVAPYIGLKNGNTLLVEDLITQTPATSADAEAIKKRLYENPLWRKLIIDSGEKYAIFMIEPVASDEMDKKRPELIAAAQEKLQGLDYRLAGMGVMYNELNRLSMRDGMVFTGISYIIIVGLVFLLFRSWLFLKIEVTTILLAGIGYMGIYGLCRGNFNMVTVILPTLVIILSIADVGYIRNIYMFRRERIMANREEGLIAMFAECITPCFFTSIANGLGFFSIVVAPMAILRGFGKYAGFACFFEYFVAMITMAFFLGNHTLTETDTVHRPFEDFMAHWVPRIKDYYKYLLGILAVVTLIALGGISVLEVDTYSMGFLYPSNLVRQDSDKIEETYGYYLPLEARLRVLGPDGKAIPDGIKDPDFLKRLEKCHTDLEKIPQIQRAASIVDVICRLNQVWTDDSSASYRIPDTANAISQLLMTYESDSKNDLKHMTDTSAGSGNPIYSEARLTVRVPMVSAMKLRKIEETVKGVLKENFASTTVEITFGGYVPLYTRLINFITESQITSLGTAILTTFGIMAILLRRFQAMILGAIPNVFPIIITLGFMGLLGIKLDIATVTIAGIAMGISVDGTVRILYLYYFPDNPTEDPVESICQCLIKGGPGIIATFLIYGLGFTALVLASIKSVALFGGLLAFTIITGMIIKMTILPSIFFAFRKYL